MRNHILLLFALCCCHLAFGAAPRPLRIAAASDLRFALGDVVAEFKKQRPDINTETVFGSSGNLYAQLTNGAPFDVFLSADADYPAMLAAAGHAYAETSTPYAAGHIVLWVTNDSPIDLARLGLKSLTHTSVSKVAMANPKHAPYGRAARAMLENADLYTSLQAKIILGDNVAQAMQFAESKSVDIGIVAQSLAQSPPMRGKGRYWVVPHDLYPALKQVGIVTKHARSLAESKAFLEFLVSNDARKMMAAHGFTAPGV